MEYIKDVDPLLSNACFRTKPVTINIEGEINTDTASCVATSVTKCISSKQPVLLVYIDSEGGCVYSAQRIVSLLDELKERSVRVITINVQKTFSAAVLVFAAGNRRYTLPNSVFMVHKPSCEALGGEASSIQTEAQETLRLEHFFKKYLRGIGVQIKLKKAQDLYLTADQAMDQHLATHWGMPRLTAHVSVSFELTCNHKSKTKKKKRKREDER